MPTKIQLPTCLMDALEDLFPTLEWERVSFFIGIKFPFNIRSRAAMVPSGFKGFRQTLRLLEWQAPN